MNPTQLSFPLLFHQAHPRPSAFSTCVLSLACCATRHAFSRIVQWLCCSGSLISCFPWQMIRLTAGRHHAPTRMRRGQTTIKRTRTTPRRRLAQPSGTCHGLPLPLLTPPFFYSQQQHVGCSVLPRNTCSTFRAETVALQPLVLQTGDLSAAVFLARALSLRLPSDQRPCFSRPSHFTCASSSDTSSARRTLGP